VLNGRICLGSSFTINPIGAPTYTISGGSAIVSPTTNTVYTITALPIGSICSADTGLSSVKVFPAPTLSLMDTSICLADSVLLTASANGSVSWYASDTSSVVLKEGSTYKPYVLATDTFYAQSSVGANKDTLFTTLAGFTSSNGNMFDVQANSSDIIVKNFDVHLGDIGAHPVQVWYRPGTFVGFTTSNAGWTKVYDSTIISNGYTLLSPLNGNFTVTIPKGQRYSFYITVTDGSSYVYSRGTKVGAVAASNADVSIFEGHGGGYFSVTFNPRVFNGRMYYEQPILCSSAKLPVIVTVNSPTFSYDTIKSCTSITWNTQLIDTSGTYSTMLTNAAGCDSTANLFFTKLNTSASFDTLTNCNAIVWNTQNISATGTYSFTTTNAAGCDSTANLFFTKLNTSASFDTLANCNAIVWNSQNISATGNYSFTSTNAAGCDSTANLFFTKLNTSASFDTLANCNAIIWNMQNISATGNYSFTITNAAGCDSTANLFFTKLNTSASFDTLANCNAIVWNTQNISATGNYSFTTTNAAGCDSTANLFFTKLNTSSSFDTLANCNAIVWNTQNISATGNYSFTTTNADGCDSTANLFFTKLTTTTSFDTIINCSSFIWNGLNVDTTGIYVETIQNVAGCDSIATLVFTKLNTSSSYDTLANCDAIVWNAQTISATGPYLEYLVNTSGCDSFANLYFRRLQADSSVTTISDCDTITWNTQTITASGTYTALFTNSAGCDSTAQLIFTKLVSTASIDSLADCNPIIWNGQNIDSAGTYIAYLTNAAGCDSVASLIFTKSNTTSTNTTIISCDTIMWNNQQIYLSGVYVDSFVTPFGCDSITTLNYTKNVTTSSVDSISDCNDRFWNGQFISTTGTYTSIGTNAAGCDSISTLYFTKLNSSSFYVAQNGCDPITWNGLQITGTGYYTYLFTNSEGCDSIDILDFTLLPSNSVNNFDTICEGDSILFDGIYRTTTGIYYDTTINNFGCNDYNILHLEVITLPQISINISPASTLCFGDTLLLEAFASNGVSWSNGISNAVSFTPTLGTNDYLVTAIDNYGCINIDTVNVLINSVPNLTCNIDTIQICNGNSIALIGTGADTLTWSGGVINNAYFMPTISSTYTLTGVNAGGCAQTKIAHIDIALLNTSLALSAGNNMLSSTGTDSTEQVQIDGTTLTYSDSNCNLMLQIEDVIGGSTLGLVKAIVAVDSSAVVHGGIAYSPRWFDISPSQQGPAQITIYQTQADFDVYNNYAAANGLLQLPTSTLDSIGISKMRILKVSGGDLSSGTYTYLLPNKIIWNTTNNYWEITFDVASFSKFYVFAGNNAPLEIGLNLQGSIVNNNNVLRWKVPQTLAFERFELQLQQNNTFATIAKLAGNTTAYEHVQPNQNTNQYRVIGYDKNNVATISNAVTLTKIVSQEVTVYPNPTYDNITISIVALKAATANIKLLDQLGKLIIETDAPIIKGTNNKQIDMKDLPAGTYYLIVQFGEVSYSTKVVKL
jgi:hypothetical protein